MNPRNRESLGITGSPILRILHFADSAKCDLAILRTAGRTSSKEVVL